MKDRGMMKWRAFNAVIPAKELLKKDEPFHMPILSKDEISELEETIADSYYAHSEIELEFFENKKLLKIKGVVTKIDSTSKNIIINSKKINFRQIYHIN